MNRIFKLPSEGLTLEALCSPIRSIFLQPIVTTALLLASARDPQRAKRLLSLAFKDIIGLATFEKTLKALVGVGMLYRLNKFLSNRAINNFIKDRSWDWRKEIVVITGGSSGIGELMVHKFAKKSIKVIALDINPPRTPFPTNTLFYQVDVTSSDAIHETAQKIRQEVGEPTVLINNAGVGTGQTVLDETEEQITRTFNVNTISHFWLAKEFLPHMIKQNHGHIVTIASMASFAVLASNVDYSCTKAAALAFHEGLTQELKYRYNANKVRTTVVHPTWVRTPLIEELLCKKDFNDFVLDRETVADAVVNQILKGEGAQLILPGRFSLLSGLRGWPHWMQEIARNSKANLLRRDGA